MNIIVNSAGNICAVLLSDHPNYLVSPTDKIFVIKDATIIKAINEKVEIRYNKETNSIQKVGLFDHEKIQQLKNENVDLLLNSATAEINIDRLQDENADLMFRLANLEMKGML